MLDLDGHAPAVRFLIRDRDAKCCRPFDTVRRSEGMRVIRTPIRAPNANAFAEQLLETMRAECLDWTRILARRQLHRTLRTDAQTTTAVDPIAPSASHHRSSRPGRRSRSTRATVAGWICSVDASTSITPPPHDRIRVSDPHGSGRREKTLSGADDFAGLDSVAAIRRIFEIAVLDALGLDNSIARCRVLIAGGAAATNLLKVGELEDRVAALEAAQRRGADAAPAGELLDDGLLGDEAP
jgi:hypothetical protein